MNSLEELKNNFLAESINKEDDIKIKFFSEIVKPILNEVNPSMSREFLSEHSFYKGGRADAVFNNIAFEYKDRNAFKNENGQLDAIYGRINSDSGLRDHDRGLYDYLITHSEIKIDDSQEVMESKLSKVVGVGFDGVSFIFVRFSKTNTLNKINGTKTALKAELELNLEFNIEFSDFDLGLRRLVLLLKQIEKMELNKKNLISLINPRQSIIRENILKLYSLLNDTLGTEDNPVPSRVETLYNEWDRVFGIMFGNDEEATEFNETIPSIRKAYNIPEKMEINMKRYLFSLQTYYNILLKLLVNSFLNEIINPTFSSNKTLSLFEIHSLFEGRNKEQQKLIDNFFEVHFYEWFTYSENFDVEIVNSTLELLDKFEVSTYVLKPESIQDILQEIYMELIPKELRHLMGEYFSPDWIVEFVLDSVDYDGDIEKSLIDPTSGSGAFLTQAIKRVIKKQGGKLGKEEILKITNNIVGFDLNPISAVSAKANYIFAIFSTAYDLIDNFGESISIPVYIADSVLSPVVYTEENENFLVTKTSVGDFKIPKFDTFEDSKQFLSMLSNSIDLSVQSFEEFEALISHEQFDVDMEIVKNLWEQLYVLHRASKDSFWPKILKNSFAPALIGDKFDFVVGNPPWIGWKSMSKTYREGTLEVWQSYGIFENKSAYDKKTTHDDFGMAVTYVAVDQYLKMNGKMGFLLPASFLKSTKGGEGFRKFKIVRNQQSIPFKLLKVDDFSDVKLFTVPTMLITLTKGEQMTYPMNDYVKWSQIGRKSSFDSHLVWDDVKKKVSSENLYAQPVDRNNIQSAWLTLKDMVFANKVLDQLEEPAYRGRKGIEPAGAKGVYLLKKPQVVNNGLLKIENDFSRQRRKDILDKGINPGEIESEFIYPMLGGRNIDRWLVKSNEFMLVPHTKEYKYGLPTVELIKRAPKTYEWLTFYHDELLASRIQNGKFFNPELQPFYRLDNIGDYTFSPYKVLWKEQTGSMSAVVVSSYLESIPNADENLFKNSLNLSGDKNIVVDSKVLMLGLDDLLEAYFVTGVINSLSVREVIDGYAINTNRGTDILKYVSIPKYDSKNELHKLISDISKEIHDELKKDSTFDISDLESKLDDNIHKLFY